MSSTGILLVTTTWNERENVENLILSIRTVLKGVPHEIIVDDDASDGQSARAEELQRGISTCALRVLL